ncbi:MAG: universal stress protein [Bacteroidota bacterium]
MNTKILVPVDFSECSINATQYAASLAKKMNASLVLLHSLNVPVTHGELGATTILGELTTGIEEDIEENFQKLVLQVPLLKDISYTKVIRHSFVTDAVYHTSANEAIDLIVMGTKGAHGLEEMIMGSNTYSVIRDIDIPVLAIPEGAVFKSIQGIVFASDYKTTNTDNLKPLLSFTKTFGSEIHVLHVASEKNISQNELEEAKKFQRFFKNVRHHFHFIQNENLETSIENYVKDHRINMISLLPRKHSLFEQIFGKTHSRKIILHTEVPLLALPS